MIARLLFILCAMLFAWPAARADSCTASMPNISFGNVSPIAGIDYTTSGTLRVTCTWTLANLGIVLFPNVSVCVSAGVGSAGTSIAARAMASGSARLPFNLYRDNSYAASSIWGATSTPGTAPVNTTMGGLLAIGSLNSLFTVYGKIPAISLAGVTTSNGAETVYTSSFAGAGTIHYAFYGALQAPVACTSGQSNAFLFDVQASVTNACDIDTTTLAFGTNIGLLNGAVRAQSTITVKCTAGNPYQISLDGGSVAGNPLARKMRKGSGGALVGYELSNTLDGAAWGDGTQGTIMQSGTGTGASQAVQVYGRVPAQTTPVPGEYRDTVTATVYF